MPVTCVLGNNLVAPTEDGFIILSLNSSQHVVLPPIDEKSEQIKKTNGQGSKGGTSGQKQSKGKLQLQPDDLFICATGSSESGKLIAVADAHKRLFLYQLAPIDKPLFSCITERKVADVTFTSDAEKLLIMDRTGDVFIWNFRQSSQCKPTLLLGHLSVVLDMKLASKDKYIVTCDRDEKIRVSNFPNSYNIHTYCLGHKEFVSSVCPLTCDRLVSGSGDKTLRLWDMNNGKQLASFEYEFPVKQVLLVDSLVLVTFFCQRKCQLMQVTKDDQLVTMGQVDFDFDVLEMHHWMEKQVVLITNSSAKPVVFGQIDANALKITNNCITWTEKCRSELDKVLKVVPQDEIQLKFRLKSVESYN